MQTSAETKHTEGPWRFAGFTKSSNFADHVAIIQADNCKLASVRGGVRDNKAVAEANARLIAAAPDLLEALQAFVSEHDGWDDTQLSRRVGMAGMLRIRKARAAIAKATA